MFQYTDIQMCVTLQINVQIGNEEISGNPVCLLYGKPGTKTKRCPTNLADTSDAVCFG